MILETRAVPPMQKNGYVLGCEETHVGVIIDPGDEVKLLLDCAAQHRLTIAYILLTHAHVDHISGVGVAKQALGAPVVLHRDDQFLYERVVQQALAFGLQADPQPPVDQFYDGPGPWRFGRYQLFVHHTPGHSPGGVCLQVGGRGAAAPVLFAGDSLFAGSIGRTDLPGGDYATLIRSIREVLFPFGDEAIVHPGHGPSTTIGRERLTNPFLSDE
ncbi:MAG: MBL fold metallo-hydrolase [Luteitalea sp.]|nr:MBL fold metallo-hydrolase [Luteitalea sp.]